MSRRKPRAKRKERINIDTLSANARATSGIPRDISMEDLERKPSISEDGEHATKSCMCAKYAEIIKQLEAENGKLKENLAKIVGGNFVLKKDWDEYKKLEAERDKLKGKVESAIVALREICGCQIQGTFRRTVEVLQRIAKQALEDS